MPEILEAEREQISQQLLESYVSRLQEIRQAPADAAQEPSSDFADAILDPVGTVVMRSVNSTTY